MAVPADICGEVVNELSVGIHGSEAGGGATQITAARGVDRPGGGGEGEDNTTNKETLKIATNMLMLNNYLSLPFHCLISPTSLQSLVPVAMTTWNWSQVINEKESRNDFARVSKSA